MRLTPDEIEQERTRFEAWWYGNYGAKIKPPVAYFQWLGNGYLSDRIEGQWQSWIAAIESERERVSENAIVNDMALLIKRMARSIAVGSAGANGIADKALDYLKRKGLQGSILRDENCGTSMESQSKGGGTIDRGHEGKA